MRLPFVPFIDVYNSKTIAMTPNYSLNENLALWCGCFTKDDKEERKNGGYSYISAVNRARSKKYDN